MRAAGVVLAGGRSRRMGTDKALLTLGGVPAVVRVVDALRGRGPVVVVAARAQVLPPLEAIVVRDAVEGAGPLPALLRGLGVAAGTGAGAVLVCATDVPLLHPAVVGALLARLEAHDVVLPVFGGREQYLTAVYRTTLGAADGATRVRDLLEGADVLRVDVRELRDDEAVARDDPGLLSFLSANDPREWSALEAAYLDSPGEQSNP